MNSCHEIKQSIIIILLYYLFIINNFASIDEIKIASLKELKAISKTVFQSCFEEWKKALAKSVISNENYFEGNNIFVNEEINFFILKTKFLVIFLTHLVYMYIDDRICRYFRDVRFFFFFFTTL